MSDVLEGKDFLEYIEKKLLECREGDEIIPMKLCELANSIYPMYNKIFGTGFLVDTLKNDLKKSSSVVQKAIENNPEEYKYVSMMYSYNIKKYENLEIVKKSNANGITSFLWMKRALEFIFTFLEKSYITNLFSKLVDCAQETYEEVLKAYHRLLTRNIVKLCIKLFPSKEKLTQRLGFKSNEEVQTAIGNFILLAKSLIQDISNIIEKYNCNFKDKA